MSTDLTKKLVCIALRNGVEIWVEQDRSEAMINSLTAPNPPQFIKYESRLINRADVVGIFTAEDMAEHTHRKNGEWKCFQGTWHEQKQKCDCLPQKQAEQRKINDELFYKKHGYYPSR